MNPILGRLYELTGLDLSGESCNLKRRSLWIFPATLLGLFRKSVSKPNTKYLLKLFPGRASRHSLYWLFPELPIGRNSLR